MATPAAATQPLLWTSPVGRAALGTHDVGAILRAYRRATGLTQSQLGRLLVLDQSYISRIETGQRAITDLRSLRHIADVLGVPPPALGLSHDADSDLDALLQLAASTLRLADVARQSGRASDAVAEVWPLLARLQARATDLRDDRRLARLLARSQLSFGVALGHVLPEEQLTTAAHWTQHALSLAIRLEDRSLEIDALRMHGNELRKCGHILGAIGHLTRAAARAEDAPTRGSIFGLLARATAELGDARTFDAAIDEARRLLDADHRRSALFNAFTLKEIRVRGLLATGRPVAARALVDGDELSAELPAVPPQWRVLNDVTSATALLESGDVEGSLDRLGGALVDAERYRLPHQVQRALRVLDGMPAEDAEALIHAGATALRRLRPRLH